MGLFDKARQAIGFVDEAREFLARDENCGRIVAVEGRGGLQWTVRVEIHEEGRDPRVLPVKTTPPRGVEPRVGDDVAIVNRSAPESTVETFAILWKKPPQYGVPDPTQGQIQAAAYSSIL